MEVRSLKAEGIPATGYMTAQEAQPDMSDYLILRWIRLHRFNSGLTPAQTEQKLNVMPGIS
jgi:putative transposase